MLGDKAILEAMADGRIVIAPFNEEQLGPNSYDLRIGEWIVRQKEQTGGIFHVDLGEKVNPLDMWRHPQRAEGGIIRLQPGELILAHTDEYVACYDNVCGEMASRSTVMRMGIAVCVDAGLGDVGFASKWTMEVYNHTKFIVNINVGSRVAQMKFHEVVGNEKDYRDKGGTYGIGEWTPDDMLPRSSMT